MWRTHDYDDNHTVGAFVGNRILQNTQTISPGSSGCGRSSSQCRSYAAATRYIDLTASGVVNDVCGASPTRNKSFEIDNATGNRYANQRIRGERGTLTTWEIDGIFEQASVKLNLWSARHGSLATPIGEGYQGSPDHGNGQRFGVHNFAGVIVGAGAGTTFSATNTRAFRTRFNFGATAAQSGILSFIGVPEITTNFRINHRFTFSRTTGQFTLTVGNQSGVQGIVHGGIHGKHGNALTGVWEVKNAGQTTDNGAFIAEVIGGTRPNDALYKTGVTCPNSKLGLAEGTLTIHYKEVTLGSGDSSHTERDYDWRLAGGNCKDTNVLCETRGVLMATNNRDYFISKQGASGGIDSVYRIARRDFLSAFPDIRRNSNLDTNEIGLHDGLLLRHGLENSAVRARRGFQDLRYAGNCNFGQNNNSCRITRGHMLVARDSRNNSLSTNPADHANTLLQIYVFVRAHHPNVALNSAGSDFFDSAHSDLDRIALVSGTKAFSLPTSGTYHYDGVIFGGTGSDARGESGAVTRGFTRQPWDNDAFSATLDFGTSTFDRFSSIVDGKEFLASGIIDKEAGRIRSIDATWGEESISVIGNLYGKSGAGLGGVWQSANPLVASDKISMGAFIGHRDTQSHVAHALNFFYFLGQVYEGYQGTGNVGEVGNEYYLATTDRTTDGTDFVFVKALMEYYENESNKAVFESPDTSKRTFNIYRRASAAVGNRSGLFQAIHDKRDSKRGSNDPSIELSMFNVYDETRTTPAGHVNNQNLSTTVVHGNATVDIAGHSFPATGKYIYDGVMFGNRRAGWSSDMEGDYFSMKFDFGAGAFTQFASITDDSPCRTSNHKRANSCQPSGNKPITFGDDNADYFRLDLRVRGSIDVASGTFEAGSGPSASSLGGFQGSRLWGRFFGREARGIAGVWRTENQWSRDWSRAGAFIGHRRSDFYVEMIGEQFEKPDGTGGDHIGGIGHGFLQSGAVTRDLYIVSSHIFTDTALDPRLIEGLVGQSTRIATTGVDVTKPTRVAAFTATDILHANSTSYDGRTGRFSYMVDKRDSTANMRVVRSMRGEQTRNQFEETLDLVVIVGDPVPVSGIGAMSSAGEFVYNGFISTSYRETWSKYELNKSNSFSAKFNFSDSTFSDFHVGRTAEFAHRNLRFNNVSGTIDRSQGTFISTTGTLGISSTTEQQYSILVQGSFYGPGALGIGGVWRSTEREARADELGVDEQSAKYSRAWLGWFIGHRDLGKIERLGASFGESTTQGVGTLHYRLDGASTPEVFIAASDFQKEITDFAQRDGVRWERIPFLMQYTLPSNSEAVASPARAVTIRRQPRGYSSVARFVVAPGFEILDGVHRISTYLQVAAPLDNAANARMVMASTSLFTGGLPPTNSFIVQGDALGTMPTSNTHYIYEGLIRSVTNVTVNYSPHAGAAFTMRVNFGSREFTHFEADIGGIPLRASGTIADDGTFTSATGAPGTGTAGAGTATYGRTGATVGALVTGRFFGASARGIGGVWRTTGSNLAAANQRSGAFVGRQFITYLEYDRNQTFTGSTNGISEGYVRHETKGYNGIYVASTGLVLDTAQHGRTFIGELAAFDGSTSTGTKLDTLDTTRFNAYSHSAWSVGIGSDARTGKLTVITDRRDRNANTLHTPNTHVADATMRMLIFRRTIDPTESIVVTGEDVPAQAALPAAGSFTYTGIMTSSYDDRLWNPKNTESVFSVTFDFAAGTFSDFTSTVRTGLAFNGVSGAINRTEGTFTASQGAKLGSNAAGSGEFGISLRGRFFGEFGNGIGGVWRATDRAAASTGNVKTTSLAWVGAFLGHIDIARLERHGALFADGGRLGIATGHYGIVGDNSRPGIFVASSDIAADMARFNARSGDSNELIATIANYQLPAATTSVVSGAPRTTRIARPTSGGINVGRGAASQVQVATTRDPEAGMRLIMVESQQTDKLETVVVTGKPLQNLPTRAAGQFVYRGLIYGGQKRIWKNRPGGREFAMRVNFAEMRFTNFFADFGAAGTLQAVGTIAANGTFTSLANEVTSLGDWTRAHVSGRFYGDGAKGVGGVWRTTGSDIEELFVRAGAFIGQRQDTHFTVIDTASNVGGWINATPGQGSVTGRFVSIGNVTDAVYSANAGSGLLVQALNASTTSGSNHLLPASVLTGTASNFHGSATSASSSLTEYRYRDRQVRLVFYRSTANGTSSRGYVTSGPDLSSLPVGVFDYEIFASTSKTATDESFDIGGMTVRFDAASSSIISFGGVSTSHIVNLAAPDGGIFINNASGAFTTATATATVSGSTQNIKVWGQFHGDGSEVGGVLVATGVRGGFVGHISILTSLYTTGTAVSASGIGGGVVNNRPVTFFHDRLYDFLVARNSPSASVSPLFTIDISTGFSAGIATSTANVRTGSVTVDRARLPVTQWQPKLGGAWLFEIGAKTAGAAERVFVATGDAFSAPPSGTYRYTGDLVVKKANSPGENASVGTFAMSVDFTGRSWSAFSGSADGHALATSSSSTLTIDPVAGAFGASGARFTPSGGSAVTAGIHGRLHGAGGLALSGIWAASGGEWHGGFVAARPRYDFKVIDVASNIGGGRHTIPGQDSFVGSFVSIGDVADVVRSANAGSDLLVQALAANRTAGSDQLGVSTSSASQLHGSDHTRSTHLNEFYYSYRQGRLFEYVSLSTNGNFFGYYSGGPTFLQVPVGTFDYKIFVSTASPGDSKGVRDTGRMTANFGVVSSSITSFGDVSTSHITNLTVPVGGISINNASGAFTTATATATAPVSGSTQDVKIWGQFYGDGSEVGGVLVTTGVRGGFVGHIGTFTSLYTTGTAASASGVGAGTVNNRPVTFFHDRLYDFLRAQNNPAASVSALFTIDTSTGFTAGTATSVSNVSTGNVTVGGIGLPVTQWAVKRGGARLFEIGARTAGAAERVFVATGDAYSAAPAGTHTYTGDLVVKRANSPTENASVGTLTLSVNFTAGSWSTFSGTAGGHALATSATSTLALDASDGAFSASGANFTPSGGSVVATSIHGKLHGAGASTLSGIWATTSDQWHGGFVAARPQYDFGAINASSNVAGGTYAALGSVATDAVFRTFATISFNNAVTQAGRGEGILFDAVSHDTSGDDDIAGLPTGVEGKSRDWENLQETFAIGNTRGIVYIGLYAAASIVTGPIYEAPSLGNFHYSGIFVGAATANAARFRMTARFGTASSRITSLDGSPARVSNFAIPAGGIPVNNATGAFTTTSATATVSGANRSIGIWGQFFGRGTSVGAVYSGIGVAGLFIAEREQYDFVVIDNYSNIAGGTYAAIGGVATDAVFRTFSRSEFGTGIFNNAVTQAGRGEGVLFDAVSHDTSGDDDIAGLPTGVEGKSRDWENLQETFAIGNTRGIVYLGSYAAANIVTGPIYEAPSLGNFHYSGIFVGEATAIAARFRMTARFGTASSRITSLDGSPASVSNFAIPAGGIPVNNATGAFTTTSATATVSGANRSIGIWGQFFGRGTSVGAVYSGIGVAGLFIAEREQYDFGVIDTSSNIAGGTYATLGSEATDAVFRTFATISFNNAVTQAGRGEGILFDAVSHDTSGDDDIAGLPTGVEGKSRDWENLQETFAIGNTRGIVYIGLYAAASIVTGPIYEAPSLGNFHYSGIFVGAATANAARFRMTARFGTASSRITSLDGSPARVSNFAIPAGGIPVNNATGAFTTTSATATVSGANRSIGIWGQFFGRGTSVGAVYSGIGVAGLFIAGRVLTDEEGKVASGTHSGSGAARASLINNAGSAAQETYFISPDITAAVASAEAGTSVVNAILDQDASTYTDATLAGITEVEKKTKSNVCAGGNGRCSAASADTGKQYNVTLWQTDDGDASLYAFKTSGEDAVLAVSGTPLSGDLPTGTVTYNGMMLSGSALDKLEVLSAAEGREQDLALTVNFTANTFSLDAATGTGAGRTARLQGSGTLDANTGALTSDAMNYQDTSSTATAVTSNLRGNLYGAAAKAAGGIWWNNTHGGGFVAER